MLTIWHVLGCWIGYTIAIFTLPEVAPAALVIAVTATIFLLAQRTFR